MTCRRRTSPDEAVTWLPALVLVGLAALFAWAEWPRAARGDLLETVQIRTVPSESGHDAAHPAGLLFARVPILA